MTRTKFIFILFLVSISIATVIGAGVVQRRIFSRGTVHVATFGIEAFWDENCTNIVTEIYWGTLWPGDIASKVLYVENAGNTAVILSMVTENWVPAGVESFISVIWDAEDSTLSAGEVKIVNLTMSISSSITSTTNFSLDIVLAGDET